MAIKFYKIKDPRGCGADGTGKNVLGQVLILMEVRKELSGE